jgi:ferrochelatase
MPSITTPIGVLLMAYGGPDSLDDVEPYLLDIRAGRPTSPELVAEIKERYALIGGRSPLLDITRQQAEAL